MIPPNLREWRKPLSALDVAKQYFDAWTRRDSSGIAATFAEGGTYNAPASGGELTGQDLEGYTSGLFSAFPDLSFDIVSAVPTDGNIVAAQIGMGVVSDYPRSYLKWRRKMSHCRSICRRCFVGHNPNIGVF